MLTLSIPLGWPVLVATPAMGLDGREAAFDGREKAFAGFGQSQ